MRGLDLILSILFPLEGISMKSKISTPSMIPHPGLKLIKNTCETYTCSIVYNRKQTQFTLQYIATWHCLGCQSPITCSSQAYQNQIIQSLNHEIHTEIHSTIHSGMA